MVNNELDLANLVGRAYARAVPAKKFVKLVQNRVAGATLEETDDQLAAAILPYLLPSPPSILLSYLSELLAAPTSGATPTPLLTSRTLFIHLLFYIAENDIPPIPSLLSLATILASSPSGVDEGSGSIPSLLSRPGDHFTAERVPDVGTSASAKAASSAPSSLTSPKQISTLSLLLPLLRICASMPPSPLSNLVGRAVLLLSPFPAPSLDVGLEAGQLLPALPEEISVPLRSTLSGLMADLASQDMQTSSALASAGAVTGQDIKMGEPGSQQIQNAIGQRLPINQTIAFLLERARRASRWRTKTTITEETSTPRPELLDVLRIAPSLGYQPSEFLSALLDVSIRRLMEKPVDGSSPDVGEWWGLTVEDIVEVVRWWKLHPEEKFPFPDDILTPLSAVFSSLSQQMTTFSESVSARYAALVQQSESEDDSSTFTPLDGWQIHTLQETLLSRFVHLGVLSSEQASTVAPGVPVHPMTPGESLLNRLAAESHHHLPPLAHLIQFASGAASSFTSDFIKIVKSCPSAVPPENLFTFIASQPTLITALTGTVTPAALVELLVKHLLDAPLDESTRVDDPQGSLTRFGEGVALVEAAVAHFELPLPPLLVDARSAWSYSHLSPEDKETMNGWVKAIFGSDGIEDQILLATSPQTMYKLAPTLIQQAIAATTAGQMDLDTLHSGLSYFSQPLLSWCLGGVVSWLCNEIQRQGLLSALHLVVLQDLILGHTCPEPLLRVNSDILNTILSPTSGLAEVFQSSNFDALGIRAKLDSMGLTPPPIRIVTPLRTALQPARQLELAPVGWESTLLDALDESICSKGAVNIVRELMEELSLPSNMSMAMPMSISMPIPMAIPNDSLVAFIPLLFSLRLSKVNPRPLVSALLDGWLPDFFQFRHNANTVTSGVSGELVAWVIKRSLDLSSDLDLDNGDGDGHRHGDGYQRGDGSKEMEQLPLDGLVNDLVDELEYELSRPEPRSDPGHRRSRNGTRSQARKSGGTQSQQGQESGGNEDGPGTGRASSSSFSKRDREMDTKNGGDRIAGMDQGKSKKEEMVESLVRVLRDDEDLRSRFGSLRRLDALS
ncbi:hypothetical protein IAU59_000374 [Kwoniella sp. CBS 9459]